MILARRREALGLLTPANRDGSERIAKIGSELETMQQGISDMGIVATVFQSSESVNNLLRSVISAIPAMGKPESRGR